MKRDQDLNEKEESLLKTHLERCERCRRFALSLNAILDSAARLPSIKASKGFDEQVVERVARPAATLMSSTNQRGFPRYSLLYFLAGAAATLLAVLALSWLEGTTPKLKASAILDDVIHDHREAVLDFADSVTLLPGSKPEVEVELVKKDLEDSRLLPRTLELKDLVLVADRTDRRIVLKFLDESEKFLCEVSSVIGKVPPREAMACVREIASSLRSVPFAVSVVTRTEPAELHPTDTKGLQVLRKARHAYFRGDIPQALSCFKTFAVCVENDADLTGFRDVARFSVQRCEEKLGVVVMEGVVSGTTSHEPSRVPVILQLEGSKMGPGSLKLEPGQFFESLEEEGVKFDAPTKAAVERVFVKISKKRK